MVASRGRVGQTLLLKDLVLHNVHGTFRSRCADINLKDICLFRL